MHMVLIMEDDKDMLIPKQQVSISPLLIDAPFLELGNTWLEVSG